MKKLWLLSLLFFVFSPYASAQFRADEKVIISEAYEGDLYAAGGELKIQAPVYGDLVVAGGQIQIKDSIHQDLLAAGGDIRITGAVMDDVRCAGGDVEVAGSIEGDLIVFAGLVILESEGTVKGDLIVFGGDVRVNGYVEGNIRAYAGEIELDGSVGKDVRVTSEKINFNGQVAGNVQLISEEIEISESAQIQGDLEYWCKDGELDLDRNIVYGAVIFNADLAPDEDWFDPTLGLAIPVLAFLSYIISGFLIILILNLVFEPYFQRAVQPLKSDLAKSFGFGVLYLIAIPTAILLLSMVVVGIPLAIFLLFIYAFMIIFGPPVASLLIVHFIRKTGDHSWSKFVVAIFALAMSVILALISLIPILGFLFSLVIIAITYGSLILARKAAL